MLTFFFATLAVTFSLSFLWGILTAVKPYCDNWNSSNGSGDKAHLLKKYWDLLLSGQVKFKATERSPFSHMVVTFTYSMIYLIPLYLSC